MLIEAFPGILASSDCVCASGSELVNRGADRDRSNTAAEWNSQTDILSTRY